MGQVNTPSLENIDSNIDNQIDSQELLTTVKSLDNTGIESFLIYLDEQTQNPVLLSALKKIIKELNFEGLDNEDKEKIKILYDKLIIESSTENVGEESIDNDKKDFNSLSDTEKGELDNVGVTQEEYEEFLEVYDGYTKETLLQSVVYLKSMGLLDILLLKKIGSNNVELNNNYDLIKGYLSSESIKLFYTKGIDFSIVIENIQLGEENGLKLNANILYNLGNSVVSIDIIESLKIDESFTIKDLTKIKLYSGVDTEKLKELYENKAEVFTFFDNIDIPKHYVIELARIDFPVDDFKGFEHIFDSHSIVDIVSLYNRKNNISDEDIQFYFSKFQGKLDDVNHMTYYYIENIDQLVGGDTTTVQPYIDKGLSLVDTYLELSDGPEQLEENFDEAEKYKKELGEEGEYLSLEEIDKWFVKNNFIPSIIKFFLGSDKQFSAESLAYLSTETNWNNEYGKISSNDRRDIVNLYLNVNPNFTGNDIVFLQYYGLCLGNKYTGAINNSEEIIKKYTTENPNISGEEIINLYNFEKTDGNIEQLYSDTSLLKEKTEFTDIQIHKLLINGIDINHIIENYIPLVKIQISNENIIGILLNGYTYGEYKKSIDEENIPEAVNIIEYVNAKIKGLSDKHLSIITSKFLEGTLQSNFGDTQYMGNFRELVAMKNIGNLLDFLEQAQDITIKIGSVEYKVNGNLQFLRGLLNHANNNEGGSTDWDSIINGYGEVLNGFLETSKTIDKVYFLSSNHYYGEDNAAFQYKNIDRVKQIYQGAEMLDFTTGFEKGNSIEKSSDIISILENDLKNNPGKNIMMYVALHGDTSGNAWTSKGDLSKEDFQRLNNIAGQYDNFKMVIDSCNNKYKFGEQEIKGNITSNSGKYFSVSTYGEVSMQAYKKNEDGFAKGDFDKDGEVNSGEVELYTNINYQEGGVNQNSLNIVHQSFYKDNNGNKTSIDNQIINNS